VNERASVKDNVTPCPVYVNTKKAGTKAEEVIQKDSFITSSWTFPKVAFIGAQVHSRIAKKIFPNSQSQPDPQGYPLPFKVLRCNPVVFVVRNVLNPLYI
jgi:hypothetical protein